MTEIINPPQTVVDADFPNLEECSCMERTFFAIGVETGKQIRQLIQAEINNHMSSIETLKSLVRMLNTEVVNPADLCTKPVKPPDTDSCC
jgi:hypothetical protein